MLEAPGTAEAQKTWQKGRGTLVPGSCWVHSSCLAAYQPHSSAVGLRATDGAWGGGGAGSQAPWLVPSRAQVRAPNKGDWTTCPLLDAGPEWRRPRPGAPVPAGAASGPGAEPQVGAEQPPAPRRPRRWRLCLAHSQPQPLQRPGSGARGSSGNWLGGLKQNRASNSFPGTSLCSREKMGSGETHCSPSPAAPDSSRGRPRKQPWVGGGGGAGVEVPFLPVTHASVVSLFPRPHRRPSRPPPPALWSVPENFASRDTGTRSREGPWDCRASSSQRLGWGLSAAAPPVAAGGVKQGAGGGGWGRQSSGGVACAGKGSAGVRERAREHWGEQPEPEGHRETLSNKQQAATWLFFLFLSLSFLSPICKAGTTPARPRAGAAAPDVNLVPVGRTRASSGPWHILPL